MAVVALAACSGPTGPAASDNTITIAGFDAAPSTISLNNLVGGIPEDKDMSADLRVADIVVTDDGVGTNELYLTGADAADFKIVGAELLLRAGTVLDYEVKPVLNVTVNVDGQLVGTNPDAQVSQTFTIVDVNELPSTITGYRGSSSCDDAEERASGIVKCISKDIELVDDPTSVILTQQTAGFRFNGVDVPQGATINDAYVQFEAAGIDDEQTTLYIQGEASDDATTFSTTDFDVTLRPLTGAVGGPWTPPPWTTVGEAGFDQRTPSIASVIQEIVDRPGWTPNNSIVLVITGAGERKVVSYDGDVVNGTTGAAVLYVDYALSPPGPGAVVMKGDADPTDNEIAENAPAGTPVGITVSADDPDDDPASGDVVTYSVEDVTSPSTPRFAVDANSGVITSLATLDFESLHPDNGIALTVIATSSSDGTTASRTFELTVLDVNEPVAFNTATSTPIGPDSDPTPNVIASNAAAGEKIGVTASASDPDAGHTVTYSVVDPRFVIEGASGEIKRSATGVLDDVGEPEIILRVTASSTDGSTADHDFPLAVPNGQQTSVSLDVRVAAGTDDAEERATGSVTLTSSDLELVLDVSDQVVGVRFTDLGIPLGATITGAYIQFQANESQSVATSLRVHGEATDNPATFADIAFNVSSRARTNAWVDWGDNSANPLPAWRKGDATPAQQTPDLKAIVQEIVSRPGWTSGSSMAFIISGTGHRTAESFEGDAAAAPLLHIDFYF